MSFKNKFATVNTNKVLRDRTLAEILFFLLSFLSFFMIQSLNGMSLTSCKRFILLNIIVLYLIYKLIYLIIGNFFITVIVAGALFYIAGIANHYVNEFRGVMILPWDLLAVGTAADVAGTYEFKPYLAEVIWAIILIVLFAGCYFIKNASYKGKERLVYSCISVIVCVALFCAMVSSEAYRSIPDRLYLVERYYRNQGIPVSFLNYSKFLYAKKPADYSISSCLDIASKISDEVKQDSEMVIQPQNVIVIMNESLTDFSALGSIPELEDSISFIDGLRENTVRGELYVPVFGGTTVNSEYEFLTGNSIVFQKGCPFSYAVRSERPSIAQYFQALGYETYGIHPARPENWNRKSVYPYLGMQNFISLDDLESKGPELVNEHTTDEWDYKELIHLYENKKDDKLFIFNVTMQNHSGYEFDFEAETGKEKVDLSGYGNYPQAENYLSLLKMSDEAFESLIEYFKQVEEPTMICLFGDHQPKLEDEFYELLAGRAIDGDDGEDELRKYQTPFLIWANYDIEESDVGIMSSNYLSQLLLKTGGFEMPPFYGLLEKLQGEYPVFSTNGVIRKDGSFCTIDEVKDDTLVKEYAVLEFNNANDKDENIQWEIFIP